LLEQVANAVGFLPHNEPSEWYGTRVINFDLEYKSTPRLCLNTAISTIVDEIKEHENRKIKRSDKSQKDLRACVKAVVLNLIHMRVVLSAYDAFYLAISLDASAYGADNVKEFSGVSFRQFKAAYKAMLSPELGYVECYKSGYFNKVRGVGFRTIICGTGKLFSLVDNALADSKINFYTSQKALKKNLVVLKNGDGKKIKYSDTGITRQYQSNLKKINKLMLASDIDLSLQESEQEEFIAKLDEWADKDDYRSCYLDKSQILLRRVFNNGDWRQGGRFYGAWWHNIPKDYRKRITINGKETIELDYSSMHPTMLYARAGEMLGFDPYVLVCGIDREWGKVGFNALLNVSEDKWPKAPKGFKEVSRKVDISWQEFLRFIIKQHYKVEKHFRVGYGLTLQYLDSQIAEEVMLYFTNKGIVCLPIHDSFIVERGYKAELEEVRV